MQQVQLHLRWVLPGLSTGAPPPPRHPGPGRAMHLTRFHLTSKSEGEWGLFEDCFLQLSHGLCAGQSRPGATGLGRLLSVSPQMALWALLLTMPRSGLRQWYAPAVELNCAWATPQQACGGVPTKIFIRNMRYGFRINKDFVTGRTGAWGLTSCRPCC